jgi:hypothetical protein
MAPQPSAPTVLRDPYLRFAIAAGINQRYLHRDHLPHRRLHGRDQCRERVTLEAVDGRRAQRWRRGERDPACGQEAAGLVVRGDRHSALPDCEGRRVRLMPRGRRWGRRIIFAVDVQLDQSALAEGGEHVDRLASRVAVHEHPARLVAVADHQARISIALSVTVGWNRAPDQISATGRLAAERVRDGSGPGHSSPLEARKLS